MLEKLIGIAFASAATDILLSGSSFRKYIKTVTGGIFALILIGGIFSLKAELPPLPDLSGASEALEKSKEEYDIMLRERVMLSVEEKIREELSRGGIEAEDVIIDFFPDYTVKKIRIKLKNGSEFKEKAINILKRMGFEEGVTVWG